MGVCREFRRDIVYKIWFLWILMTFSWTMKFKECLVYLICLTQLSTTMENNQLPFVLLLPFLLFSTCPRKRGRDKRERDSTKDGGLWFISSTRHNLLEFHDEKVMLGCDIFYHRQNIIIDEKYWSLSIQIKSVFVTINNKVLSFVFFNKVTFFHLS